jgi:hypothetical protein
MTPSRTRVGIIGSGPSGVDQLATALIAHSRDGRDDLPNGYSESALRRIRRAEQFA